MPGNLKPGKRRIKETAGSSVDPRTTKFLRLLTTHLGAKYPSFDQLVNTLGSIRDLLPPDTPVSDVEDFLERPSVAVEPANDRGESFPMQEMREQTTVQVAQAVDVATEARDQPEPAPESPDTTVSTDRELAERTLLLPKLIFSLSQVTTKENAQQVFDSFASSVLQGSPEAIRCFEDTLQMLEDEEKKEATSCREIEHVPALYECDLSSVAFRADRYTRTQHKCHAVGPQAVIFSPRGVLIKWARTWRDRFGKALDLNNIEHVYVYSAHRDSTSPAWFNVISLRVKRRDFIRHIGALFSSNDVPEGVSEYYISFVDHSKKMPVTFRQDVENAWNPYAENSPRRIQVQQICMYRVGQVYFPIVKPDEGGPDPEDCTCVRDPSVRCPCL